MPHLPVYSYAKFEIKDFALGPEQQAMCEPRTVKEHREHTNQMHKQFAATVALRKAVEEMNQRNRKIERESVEQARRDLETLNRENPLLASALRQEELLCKQNALLQKLRYK
jgi:hypothetical protein